MMRSKMMTTCHSCGNDVCLECSTLGEKGKRTCLTCWYYAFDMATEMRTGGCFKSNSEHETITTKSETQHFDMTKDDSEAEGSAPDSDYEVVDDDMNDDDGRSIVSDIQSRNRDVDNRPYPLQIPPLDLRSIRYSPPSSSGEQETSDSQYTPEGSEYESSESQHTARSDPSCIGVKMPSGD